jgi:DNA-binding NtrC family response regulator
MAARPTILLVDDDESTREYLSLLLAGRGYDVEAAASGPEALECLRAGPPPAAILVDMLMPGMDGLAFLEEARATGTSAPAIVISANDRIRSVVDAMNRGAADYLTKPFDETELELAIQNALEKQRLREEVSHLRRRLAEAEPAADTLGSSPSMQHVREIARQIADTDAPVLLLGETGVGKEVVARLIHARSARADKALVRVNCAAIPHDLLESELFGHERGAFSGALQARPGKFEQAQGGSLLLDEITEMGPALQAKLLHVLQDGEFTRLGGRRPMRADARVFAATNRNLERTVAEGRFREDVYFRLNVVRIEVPPLRARREDIPLLCESFLRRYTGRYGRPERTLPAALIEAFLRYEWPGNVRELENAVRRFVILPDLLLALAELRRPGAALAPAGPGPHAPEADVGSLRSVGAAAAESAERVLVARVLGETRWNRREAARRLKISYKALLNRIKRWSLDDSGAPRAGSEALPEAASRGRR